VIPEVIVGRTDDGTRWITTVAPREASATAVDDLVASLTASESSGVGPSSFTVTSARPPDEWCDAVVSARDMMKAGRLDKVVLARMVDVHADLPIDVRTVLDRLAAAYPDCYVFSIAGRFVGASPELLVARAGDIVRSHPMAGTTPRAGDPAVDARLAAALLASPKMREEHQITIDMVHDTLLPWCSYLDYEAEPGVVSMTNVQHLATLVEGRLSQPAPSVLELVQALHPTPAVCGSPRDIALEVIAELEGLERGCYAGTVGWVDAAGNGTWAVSIRCADIDGSHARLYAGNGIVADSDPDIELTETRAKLQALLSAIVRP
jgi:isochorismate synthase